MECRVREAVTGGTHRVFLADVVQAQAREGSPLAYYRGKFGRFELAQDAKTYQRIRSMVLNCVLGPDQELDQELDAPTLAESLGAGLSSIHYALTRLVGEGLVLRTAERGYVVTPLDAARSDDAFDARLVIELGVAELTVGRLSPEQLAELRMLAQTSVARLEGGGVVDVAEYVAASVRFHAFLPALTGSPALQEAYERLSIADLMSRALTSETSVNPQMAADHLALADAYERANFAEVRRIIREHSAGAKRNQRADLAALAIRAAGSASLPTQAVSPQVVSPQVVSLQAVPAQRET